MLEYKTLENLELVFNTGLISGKTPLIKPSDFRMMDLEMLKC